METRLAILAGAIFAISVTAHTQSAAPSAPQASAPPNAAEAARDPVIPNGPAVTVELNSSLDSKKAKVGDKVEARTLEALRNGNEIIVPKGTKLIGHVTEAAARAKGDSESSLAIQFDKALPKKEQEIPLHVMMLAVAPPAPVDFSPSAEPSSGPVGGGAAANGSPMGSSHVPTSSASVGGGVNPAPGLDNSSDTNPNQPVPGAAGPLPRGSRGIYGLKDLTLMMSKANPKEPTTLITSTGKEVRLDSGTRLLLVAEAGPATPSK